MNPNLDSLKYPIGKFQWLERMDAAQIENWTISIQNFPAKLNKEVENLSKTDLQKTYRDGGWTISQIIHHLADSHMNCFIRFKLALTEETPTIKPYNEKMWAELPESKDFPVESSLKIIEGIHARWAELLKNMSDSDFEKSFFHPQKKEKMNLKTAAGFYVWHGNHHLAHIRLAKK